MLLMSTTSVEARGTPTRTTRGTLDLEKGVQEGFDDEDSRRLD